ncbi:MAG: hypothetical protein NTV70_00215 [Acidobacteria bacterium]|nr:hypothetical protein [Acidobacteriota bacterium]
MLALVPVMLLCQSIRQPANGSPFDQVRVMAEMSEKRYSDQVEADAQFERVEFHQRYNHLIKAMKEFTDAYNASHGHVLPVRKIAAITRAFEALQKTDAWKRSMGLMPARSNPSLRSSFTKPDDPLGAANH